MICLAPLLNNTTGSTHIFFQNIRRRGTDHHEPRGSCLNRHYHLHRRQSSPPPYKERKAGDLGDLDIGGADIHILFGLMNPPLTLTDCLNRRVERLEDIAQTLPVHSGLTLIPGSGDTLGTANMPYANKKQLIRHLKNLQSEVVIVDIGAGTSYHALDFFLIADHHVTVATPDPTSVLDLYRFIKLAAICRVLSSFLAREAMAEALADRDFSRVEEVLDMVGLPDETSRGVAEVALRTSTPRSSSTGCRDALM